MKTTLTINGTLLAVDVGAVIPNGTITVGTGTIGSKFISNIYPLTEGLIAGTTKQTKDPNL